MRRWPLVVLLVAGVLAAAVGGGLVSRPAFAGAAGFGWTAYSPLSSEVYRPIDVATEVWTHTVGLVLLVVGAGATGAAIAALVLRRRNAVP